MKKILFFVLLWIVAIFLQSFFDIIFSFWKFNIFFCLVYYISALFRSPIYALYSFFLGLTYDYLNFSTPGMYALTFFISYYIFYFFLIREEEFLKHIWLSIFLLCIIHLLIILLNFIFFNTNYLGLFFFRALWVEIFPTIILLFGVYPLMRKLVHKINL